MAAGVSNAPLLEYVTPEQLEQRQDDVIRNAYFIDRNGRMRPKGENSKWIECLTHILVEADMHYYQGSSLMPLDWPTCPAVESVPGELTGAWVFRGTQQVPHRACRLDSE